MEHEYEASLRRAFIERHADYILLDGWSSQFLWNTTGYALAKGWLRRDPVTEAEHSSAQYTPVVYRLTDEGRKALSDS